MINAIRKAPADQEALLRLDYGAHLWMEKEIKSVANVTRQDVRELLALAASIPLKPEVEAFALDQANHGLARSCERPDPRRESAARRLSGAACCERPSKNGGVILEHAPCFRCRV